MLTAHGEATAWVRPEILPLGKDKIEWFIAAEATPRSRFNFMLRDAIRQADHVLSPGGETLLAGTSVPLAGPNDIREQLVASDIPWPTITLSTGRQVRLDDREPAPLVLTYAKRKGRGDCFQGLSLLGKTA